MRAKLQLNEELRSITFEIDEGIRKGSSSQKALLEVQRESLSTKQAELLAQEDLNKAAIK
jgi:hypothetical protein